MHSGGFRNFERGFQLDKKMLELKTKKGHHQLFQAFLTHRTSTAAPKPTN